MRITPLRATTLIVLFAANALAAGTATITIDASKPGAEISQGHAQAAVRRACQQGAGVQRAAESFGCRDAWITMGQVDPESKAMSYLQSNLQEFRS